MDVQPFSIKLFKNHKKKRKFFFFLHQLKKKDVYRKIHVYLSSVVQVSNINFLKKINNDDDDNDVMMKK